MASQEINEVSTRETDEAAELTDVSIVSDPVNTLQDDAYIQSLAGGLKVKDIRAILGIPPQFLDTTDPRIGKSKDSNEENSNDTGEDFGRTYTEKIITNMPLLLITPGTPVFMSGFSKDLQEKVLNSALGEASALDGLLGGGLSKGTSGKYYTFKAEKTVFYDYLNLMLRSCAWYLGIEKVELDGTPLIFTDWKIAPGAGNIFQEGLKKFLGTFADAIPFYADCGNTVNDSFGNTTTKPSIASTINGFSDKGREVMFFFGSTISQGGVNKLADMANEAARDFNVMEGGNFLSNIINKVQAIVQGGRIIFPEIWYDSSFGRSYSCNMKLIAPAGDKLSIFMYILVPIMYLLALCLPKQFDGQTYLAPFLVRAYYKGLFNIDMGIIESLTVTKGAEAEWTVDGLPTVVDVQFSIKDLYESMSMSATVNGLFGNTAEMDYLANCCGINISDQEVFRQAKMYGGLALGRAKDYFTSGYVNIWRAINSLVGSLYKTNQ